MGKYKKIADILVAEQKYMLSVPTSKTWHTFHLTKHVIIAVDEERFYNVLDLDKDDLVDLRKEQLRTLLCSLYYHNIDRDKEYICIKCQKQNKCYNNTMSLSNIYISYIKKLCQEDMKKTRHAIYRTRNSNKRYILFLNDSGVSVICKIGGNINNLNLLLKTSYRYNRVRQKVSETSNLQYSLQYIHSENSLYLRESKKKWLKKFNDPQITKDFNLRLEENWL